MAASNEWTEYHLTKDGWIAGSERLDFQETKIVKPPSNRVLTRKYKEYLASRYSVMEMTYSTIWTSGDNDFINDLLKVFPHPHPDFHSRFYCND